MGRKPQRFRVTRRRTIAGASAFAAWLAAPSTHAQNASLREGTPVLVRP